MKKKFSRHWIASKKIRKQRKYIFNAPLHIKQKFMAANLAKELRKKLGKRNLEVRKEDSVKVMRGKFEGKSGKISIINLKKGRIAIQGIQRQKKDGTKINVWFYPSKVQLTELVEDKKRLSRKENEEKTQEKENVSKKNYS